eukprot:19345-Ditylum_brightwellii.AAC.1
MEQVANMVKQVNNKASEIAEPRKSIQELNITIQAFAMNQTLQALAATGGRGRRAGGGRGGQGRRNFTVKYCWMCGVQPHHRSKNCTA